MGLEDEGKLPERTPGKLPDKTGENAPDTAAENEPDGIGDWFGIAGNAPETEAIPEKTPEEPKYLGRFADEKEASEYLKTMEKTVKDAVQARKRWAARMKKYAVEKEEDLDSDLYEFRKKEPKKEEGKDTAGNDKNLFLTRDEYEKFEAEKKKAFAEELKKIQSEHDAEMQKQEALSVELAAAVRAEREAVQADGAEPPDDREIARIIREHHIDGRPKEAIAKAFRIWRTESFEKAKGTFMQGGREKPIKNTPPEMDNYFGEA